MKVICNMYQNIIKLEICIWQELNYIEMSLLSDFYHKSNFRWLDLPSSYIVPGTFPVHDRNPKMSSFYASVRYRKWTKWLSREGDLECRQSQAGMVRGIVLRPRSPGRWDQTMSHDGKRRGTKARKPSPK